MKKVIKFSYLGQEGFLSIVEIDSFYYALIQKNTEKVDAIKQTNELMISYQLKPTHFTPVHVEVLESFDWVSKVYDQLEKDNNLYFKVKDDTLAVLQIDKEASVFHKN